ncbi:hypothetical protein AAF712_000080 [Marasmius tenuissimus]|uniref:Gluconokinase n=1 Tax=Marasmius tenuissimus TaxID=585030 RepID=A0ABR3AH31_9AGAR|nr:hypothetical protein PM082_000805 [Marasmius tenuissimus]
MSEAQSQPRASQKKPVLIIVMGVSGTGKTTLATALSKIYRLPYIEGDEMHPKANIDKMSNGIPLNDADREPWLELIRTSAVKMVEDQRKEHPQIQNAKAVHGVIVTCSSLKRYYRDILRGTKKVANKVEETEGEEAPDPHELPTVFVFMKGERDDLWERMSNRKGHYMKAHMLDSQLETLENPEGEEGVITVSIEMSTEEQLEKVKEELIKMDL